MTAADLKAEIETGPLAAALAPFWADVFPTEPEPPAADRPEGIDDGSPAWAAWQARQRWERISYRFGRLTPDAAFGLLAVLHDGTRRSRPFPIAVGSFTTFLAGRGLLRKIKAATTNATYPEAVRDICDLVATVTLAAPDRQVDPADPQTAGMVGALVTAGIATADDAAALAAYCARPCSRLAELGWAVDEAALHAAKAVTP